MLGEFLRARSANSRQLNFAVLSSFPFDEERGGIADLPTAIRRLDGQRITIFGYMIPMDQAENITCFALVPKLDSHLPPRITETIVARVMTGQCVGYFPDRLRLTGVLRVRVMKDDGYLVSVYDMTVEEARPAAEGRH